MKNKIIIASIAVLVLVGAFIFVSRTNAQVVPKTSPVVAPAVTPNAEIAKLMTSLAKADPASKATLARLLLIVVEGLNNSVLSSTSANRQIRVEGGKCQASDNGGASWYDIYPSFETPTFKSCMIAANAGKL